MFLKIHHIWLLSSYGKMKRKQGLKKSISSPPASGPAPHAQQCSHPAEPAVRLPAALKGTIFEGRQLLLDSISKPMLEAVVSLCIIWRGMLNNPLLLPQHCRTQCKGEGLPSLPLYGSKIQDVSFLPQMMERVDTGVRSPSCFGDKDDYICKMWIGHLK